MVKQTNLLVIGGGMAGVISAITAAQSGLSTILVRQGYGATAISSGAINISGCEEWLRRIQGTHKNIAQSINEAISLFLEVMEGTDCAYKGDGQRNYLLINNLGTIKETQLCPITMEPGNLCLLDDANILFVGIHGFSDFDADYISNSVRFLSESRLIETNLSTGSIQIQFPRVKHTANLSPFDLARLLDKEQVVSELIDNIHKDTDLSGYTHLAFPPILGLRTPRLTIEILQSKIGLPCFEILTTPPSVPGYRLQKALDTLLNRYGVEVIHGRVIDFSSLNGRISEVSTLDKTVRQDIQPQMIILCSGKFISGGIQWNEVLEESIFKLPVCVDGNFDIPSGMSMMLSDQFVGDQKIFAAGLKVDGQMHPLAPDGTIIFSNLLAAGSVISGYNYSQGQGGMGIPLISGMICGRISAEQFAGEGAFV